MNLFRQKRSLGLVAVVLAFFTACETEQTAPATHSDARKLSHEVGTVWMDKYRDLVKNSAGWTPPVASRAFGYAGVALWESVAPGVSTHQSLAGQLNQMPAMPAIEADAEYHWGLAANACMAFLAHQLFGNATPEQLAEIDALEAQFNTSLRGEIHQDVFDRSAAFGRDVAKKIADWAETDGGHMGFARNFPTDYVPPTGAGKWVPTAPAFARALQPYWGQNRPFVAQSVTNAQPPAPQAFSTEKTSRFYQQALEVYSIGKNLKPEEKKIAQYWSDDPGQPGTPPGHMMAITGQVCRNSNASLARTAEAFARAGVAVADAFIACWKCKYDYNLLRPITFIQAEIDPTWSPLLTTPPFPEYTSGHSSQSGAWAQAMSDFFGYNYPFVDETHKNRTDIDGSPRVFASFFEAAEESAVSRLFGGIHYRDANEIGVEMGKKIGRSVSSLQFIR